MTKRLENIEVENGTVRETWVSINGITGQNSGIPIRLYPNEKAQRAKTFIMDKLLNTDNPPPPFEEKGRLEDFLRVMNSILERELINYSKRMVLDA